jgi:voltage-gated potassium channel
MLPYDVDWDVMRRTRTAPRGPEQLVPGVHGRLPSLLPGRSVSLLVSLLTLLAVGPWLNEQLVGLAVWELLFTLVMLSGILRLSADRGQTLFAAFLALPAMACLWLRQFVPAVGLTQAGLGLLTLFLLYTAATVLLHVFRAETVTMDTLSGAFCVYLLMGLAWGSLDSLLYLQAPGAFRLPDGWTPTHRSGLVVDVPFNIMVYYSFTTLTAIGYGDVLPLAAASRTAAILEAVLAQFYLAVLVARLVGLHIAHTQRPE